MVFCNYCDRALIPIKRDFNGRKYHKKCWFIVKKESRNNTVLKSYHYENGVCVRIN